jgi:hypothetical protein
VGAAAAGAGRALAQAPTVLTPRSVKPVVVSSANGNLYKNGGSRTAVEEAFARILKGDDVLDSVIAGVNIVELDPVNSFHVHGNFFHRFPTGTALEPSEYTDTVIQGQGQRDDVRLGCLAFLQCPEDVQGGRLGLALNRSTDDQDRPDLADRPGRREGDSVEQPPTNVRKRDPAKTLRRGGAECTRGVFLGGSDLFEDRRDLSDDERDADENRHDDHGRHREHDLNAASGEKRLEPAAPAEEQYGREPDCDR